MKALFAPRANSILWLAISFSFVVASAAVALPMVYVRTPWNTAEFLALDQPVAFDHRHHVEDDEIACLYCHADAERGPYAGVPATEVCMGCHVQIWPESALLESVRRSYFSNQPLRWNRVYDLGDFVYFDHSVHVRRGVQCPSCHGRVEGMARVERAVPRTMGFCLDCHRGHGDFSLRDVPADRSTMTLASAPAGRRITELTTCSACHR